MSWPNHTVQIDSIYHLENCLKVPCYNEPDYDMVSLIFTVILFKLLR